MISSFKPVRKAVFPVAGLGTRLLPSTKTMPKEMLTVIDRPLIQYAVDEAREAGIEQLIFVTGRGKSSLVEHVRAEDAGLAKWQDRVLTVWKFMGRGCHPNRDTAAALIPSSAQCAQSLPPRTVSAGSSKYIVLMIFK